MAKPSANVKAGDIIEIEFGNKVVKAEVVATPEIVKKEDAEKMFRYL